MACRSIIIPGKPLGKQRPRVLKSGIAYTPKEAVNYETFVKMLYLEQHAGKKPFEGPVSMLISAFYQIPKSASKRRREAMARHHIPPTTRPDIDNIAKIIMDALAGVAYQDDKQVTSCAVNKLYSDEPKVVVYLMGGRSGMKLHFVFADVQDTYELNMFPGAGVPLRKSVVTIELTPEQTERLPRKVRLVEIIPDPGEVDPA